MTVKVVVMVFVPDVSYMITVRTYMTTIAYCTNSVHGSFEQVVVVVSAQGGSATYAFVLFTLTLALIRAGGLLRASMRTLILALIEGGGHPRYHRPLFDIPRVHPQDIPSFICRANGCCCCTPTPM